MKNYYAVVGLKFEEVHVKHMKAAQKMVDEACDRVWWAHQLKMRELNKIKGPEGREQIEALKENYALNTAPVLSLLRNKVKRKEYDKKYLEYSKFLKSAKGPMFMRNLRGNILGSSAFAPYKAKMEAEQQRELSIENEKLRQEQENDRLEFMQTLEARQQTNIQENQEIEKLKEAAEKQELRELKGKIDSKLEHIEAMRDILEKYDDHLSKSKSKSDRLYKDKKLGVKVLLDTVRDLDDYKKKDISLIANARHVYTNLALMVDKFTLALSETPQKKPVNPGIRGLYLGFDNQSIASIFNTRRTSLGWKDTGVAVLKGIIAALAFITIVPEVISRLQTQQSVAAHLFSVKGRGVMSELDQRVKASHLHSQRASRISNR